MSFINNDTQEASQETYEFCDYNNERSVLALAIKNEDLFYSLLSKVTNFDFLGPDTNKLFRTLKSIHNSGIRKFDVPLIVKAAEDLGYNDTIDLTFIEAVLLTEIAIENFETYVNKLLDDSTKYKLFINLSDHVHSVHENAKKLKSVKSEDLLASVQADILSLSLQSSAVSEPKHAADGIDEYIESIQDNKVKVVGLTTGYPILDLAVDGLIPGTLFVVAARKKMGKSTFLTNIGLNVAVNYGEPVLYIDTEMTFNQWRDRVLAILSGVKERVIKHGGFKSDPEVHKKILLAAEKLKNSKIFHYYMPGYTVDKIAALYKKYKIKENISLGIFDYIKEPESSSVNANRKEYQILGDVTTKLKDLSGQLNIPFLAAVQVGRSGEVADSDRVARYGDVVAFWGMRDAKKAEEEGYDLKDRGYFGLRIVDSRRGGRTGEWGIGYQFFKKRLTIREVAPELQIESIYDEDDHVEVGDIEHLGDTYGTETM